MIQVREIMTHETTVQAWWNAVRTLSYYAVHMP